MHFDFSVVHKYLKFPSVSKDLLAVFMQERRLCAQLKRSNTKCSLRQALLVAYLFTAHSLQLQAVSRAHSLQLQAVSRAHSLQLQAVSRAHSLQLQAVSRAHSLQLQAVCRAHNLQFIRMSFKQQSVIQVWSVYEIFQGQLCGMLTRHQIREFLTCLIIKQDTLVTPVLSLLHAPPYTTLILHCAQSVFTCSIISLYSIHRSFL